MCYLLDTTDQIYRFLIGSDVEFRFALHHNLLFHQVVKMEAIKHLRTLKLVSFPHGPCGSIRCCTRYFNSEIPSGIGDVALLSQKGASWAISAGTATANQSSFHT